MRFAISLLSVLAIASIIGTVLKQSEPYTNYVIQFGQYWFGFFKVLGLYDVYHSGWFLTILFFLVFSTGLCLYRNTPLMLREIKGFREHAKETSLRNFAHRAEFSSALPQATLMGQLRSYLADNGFRARESESDSGTLLAAKAGSYHRFGYFLTHAAIVVICVGGLIDGNVPFKVQELLGYKKAETRDIVQSKVPPESRLSPANLSFRGNVTIPEGSSADVVFLNLGDGYLVQDLPFSIALKKFHIEHYPTGQPKNFASDLIITDPATGKSFPHTITVNHPLIYKGIAIYQASFDDGGTQFSLKGWNLLTAEPKPFDLQGRMGQSTQLNNSQDRFTVEFSGFRPFNVENFSDEKAAAPAKGLAENVMGVLGSSARKDKQKDLRNVGPSFQYKVRDSQGQAREYSNYMLPMQLEGRWYLLSGMRAAPNEPFRYLRFPMDVDSTLDGFMALRAALQDKAQHTEIARRFAAKALRGGITDEALRAKLVDSASGVLDMFAAQGYEGVARFIEGKVPKAEQEKVAQVYLKLLEQTAFEAYQLAREHTKKPPVVQNDDSMQFVRDSLNSLSDIQFYGAPFYLQLASFNEVKATGLQLTRSPGKNLVFGGSVLLVLGIFAMFYIRERRMWLLVKPHSGEVLLAMSGNRLTLDFEREFKRHKENIGKLIQG